MRLPQHQPLLYARADQPSRSWNRLLQLLGRGLAIGWLSAFGIGTLGASTLGAMPLLVQAEEKDSVDESLSFCQTLQLEVSPWAERPDLSVLSEAIVRGSDLDQLCDWAGEQVLPLNFLLAGDALLAQQLIEQGVDVNAKDGNGDTPLHYVGASVENARSLIARGADVNAVNNSGTAPLHNVFGDKTAAVMALLIENGANVNAATPEDQMTPLHFASHSPTDEIAALLIQKGADVNARSNQNWTPLHYAASRADVASQLLQAGADLTIQNRSGSAIHSGSLSPEVLQLLLDASVDVNMRNIEGQTPLHAHRTNRELTRLLLLAGAEVNLKDAQGRTPLYEVNIDVAKQLVAAGAMLDVQDNLGRTPLHQAVLEEQVFFGSELVELFLNQGADASLQDNQGETALDIAQRLDKSHIVALFSSGETPADAKTPSDGSRTPMVELTASQLLAIQRQAQALLQSASEAGQSRMALEQLAQATELAQQIPNLNDRDNLLYSIGLALVALDELDRAIAIAQTMTYETASDQGLLRPNLERALIRAYSQSGQIAAVRSLIGSATPKFRDEYWAEAVKTLAVQGDLADATALIDRVTGDRFYRSIAISAVSRAYIGSEQFEQASNFLQQQSFEEPADKMREISEVVSWAGRSGQLETARAIASQLASDYQAKALADLAALHQYRAQPDLAAALLAEATQLPYDGTDWQIRFDANNEIASRYVELGQLETARQVMLAAEQASPAPEGQAYPTEQWVGAFARAGAVDRAMQLIDSMTVTRRNPAQYSLANAYVEREQYDQAITLLSQIPERISFSVPKQQLFQRIVKETLAKENYSAAKRAAQTIENSADSVSVWLRIATAYQEKQQLEKATSALDRALAIASPVERLNGWLDVDLKSKTSKADVLLAIAQGYWAAGQREQAIETAEMAVESAIVQTGAQPFDAGYFTLRAIAETARDWQTAKVQEMAALKIENRLGLAPANDSPASVGAEQIGNSGLASLIRLAYSPNQPPSEVFSRNLARLEHRFEQAENSEYPLAMFHDMAHLYGEIGRLEQARDTIEQILTLVELLPDELLPDEERDGHYSQLASTTLKNAELENQFQMLSRLSTEKGQIAVLTRMVPYLVSEDEVALSVKYFERLMVLAEQSLSDRDRSRLLVNLAHTLSNYMTGESYGLSPRTSAEVALMTRLPQHVDSPLLRTSIWISFIPNLPPAERSQAYEALSTSVKEISNGYARRNLLWTSIERALSQGAFEEATQIAYRLEGDYCRIALGWIETVLTTKDS